MTATSRFFGRLKFDARTRCWLWTGATSDFGHGVIYRGGPRGTGNVRTHRLAWEMAYGPVPPGMFVLHRCDVPACVNPAHLFLGDQSANMKDMSAKGRHSRPAARLRPADVRAIRKLKRRGVTNAEISRRFGIGKRQVRKVASGSQWRDVG